MNAPLQAPLQATPSPEANWTHGGTDALGAARFDFSTNSNACGPCPQVLAAVQAADATLYPDPAYTALRERLGTFHAVSPERILLAGSASEAIFRLTAWAHQQGVRAVHLPQHHYGDYARAAQAWALQRVVDQPCAAAGSLSAQRTLVWACEPSSPLGQAHTGWPCWLTLRASDKAVNNHTNASAASQCLLVLDRAYAPLRLSGVSSLSFDQLQLVWQLFTPNKALGLVGVRAAYLIAPSAYSIRATGQLSTDVQQLEHLAPSWPVGAHGVALLQAWTQADTQAWLTQSLHTLRHWKARQITLLQTLGWTVQPSEANYFCARPPHPIDLPALRQTHGIKLRDATSFDLPGWVRLGVLEPQAQDALAAALI